MTIKSIITWPREVCLGWSESSENVSTDTHYSVDHATAVCRKIWRGGLGLDGEVFPLAARVEVDGEKVWEWKR